MGVKSFLKKIAGPALDIGASFIPGASIGVNLAKAGLGAAGNILSQGGSPTGANPATDLSQVLGGTAEGRAKGKVDEANLLLDRGRLADSMYGNALTAKKLAASLPDTRASQAVRGDLLANMQDVTASGPARVMNNVTHFSGGARPSALGPNARAAGAALSKIGLDNIGNETMPTAPTLPDLPQANVEDKILGAATPALGIIGSIGQYLKNRPVAAGGPPFSDAGITAPLNPATLPGQQPLDALWADLKKRQQPATASGPTPQNMTGANF